MKHHNLPKVVRVIIPVPMSRLEILEEVEEDEEITLPVSTKCDVCNSGVTDAVNFCIDCAKKMCDKHVQVSLLRYVICR